VTRVLSFERIIPKQFVSDSDLCIYAIWILSDRLLRVTVPLGYVRTGPTGNL
jgi:hypothetical protein